MSLRAFLSSATVALSAVALVGCGRPAASSPPTSELAASGTTSAAMSSVSTTTSSAPAAPNGPLLATCSDGEVSLSTVDLDSGKSSVVATFAAASSLVGAADGPAPTWSVCTSGTTLSVYLARQVFSPDLDHMAVNLRDASTDSGHVGWIDAATGETTDVTALIADGAGGYSAQPQHSNALFDKDGNFGYFDGVADKYVFIDPATRTTVRSQQMQSPGTAMFQLPDGSVTDNSSGLDRGMVLTIPMPGGGVLDSSSYSPVVWIIDGTRGLEISEPVNAPNTLGVKAAGPDDPATEGEATPITPLTDYVVRSAVADPTATTAVFTASRGETLDAFRVPLNGSAQPTKITTFEQQPGQSVALIGWE
jgi:hypothetical protein